MLYRHRHLLRHNHKPLPWTEGTKRFLTLTTDQVAYFTSVYLRTRRGLLPEEIGHQLYFMGYKSFPIVCLITFLVGMTISMTSAGQLQLFGAGNLLANVIGRSMVKELAPLMAGIMMAGKIGASITAEISTMKVMDEIDALKTMGIVPQQFLMVPRLIAITLVIPLLVALADTVGIFGGLLIARVTLGIAPLIFLRDVLRAVTLSDFFIGMGKTMIFGWTVVMCAAFKGFFIQRGAEEVGDATTESVVMSITVIILLDCIFAFILY